MVKVYGGWGGGEKDCILCYYHEHRSEIVVSVLWWEGGREGGGGSGSGRWQWKRVGEGRGRGKGQIVD